MNSYEEKDVKETFCRLFVLATSHEMHMHSFTYHLSRSDFVKNIEKGHFVDIANKKTEELFFEICHNSLAEDDSFGVYNAAYWCGEAYFYLFNKLHKSFSYIFLKLPFEKLIDLYDIFHEMDYSSLLNYFNEHEKDKTILRVLCEQKCCSISKLSKAIGVSVNTLSKYNASDEALYKGSFQNIIRIQKYFDCPVSLFIEQL